MLYSDVIPLTTFLVGCLKSNDWVNGPPDHLKVLGSLEPEDVVPFLTKRLEWRITTVSVPSQLHSKLLDSLLHLSMSDIYMCEAGFRHDANYILLFRRMVF